MPITHDIKRYFVMGLHPPEFQFTITVTLEQRAYLTNNGSGVWRTVSELDIGPRQRIAVSDSHQVCMRIYMNLIGAEGQKW